MSYSLPAVLSCLASNNAWRRQATHLREHASMPRLTNLQRDLLLREAAAAERQADMWLEGAIGAHTIEAHAIEAHAIDEPCHACGDPPFAGSVERQEKGHEP